MVTKEWKLKKEISKRRMWESDCDLFKEKYKTEKFIKERTPEHIRANSRNKAIQCLHVSSTAKTLNYQEYLKKLKLSCYKTFGLMIQDLTNQNFVFEDEVEQLNDYKKKIEKGLNITYFTFRDIKTTKEEILEIINNYKLFPISDFDNIEGVYHSYFDELNISQSDLEDVKLYYKDAIKRINDCSNKTSKFEINDFTSYNHLIDNINYLENMLILGITN